MDDVPLISEKARYTNYHVRERRERLIRWLAFILTLITAIIWGSGFLINAVNDFSAHNSLTDRRPGTSSDYYDSPPLLVKHKCHEPKAKSSKIPLSLEAVREGKFRPQYKHLQWISAPASKTSDQGTYLLEDKEGDHTTYVVKSISEKDYHYVLYNGSTFVYDDEPYSIQSLIASPDLEKAILKTDSKKSWRHSSSALYWVLEVSTKQITPLFNDHDLVSVTSWAPTSDKIAFIYKNNVYLKTLESGEITQITFDGDDNIFYGKPDWVYEEEVFASDIVLWWSPQGDKLGFLRFDDTKVPVFPISYYVQDGHEDYPELVSIKYPKPGYPNPVVDLVLYDVENPEPARVVDLKTSFDDKLITEVLWVSDDHLLVKTTNRASDEMEVFLASTVDGSEANLVRKHHAKGSWFEVTSNALYIPRNESAGRDQDGYIDIVVHEGYNHLAFFSPPDSSEGKLLTSGSWEVLENFFDFSTNEVYFKATKKSSVERHYYSVSLNDALKSSSFDVKNVTDTSSDGYYTISFSSGARYALVSYQGPDVPYQRLIDLHSFETVQEIESNTKISENLKLYDIPRTEIFVVNLGNDEETGAPILANAMETRPQNFDPSRKYPVLFFVYGGPGSQLVKKTFDVGFSQAISSELDAVVVTVDGRGTGFNNNDEAFGSKYKFIVRDRLGVYEPIDQIAAASLWAKKSYVDASRIAIWGWSYGGFLTLKTLESDFADRVFSYGVSVAPVTKWRLYDTIYTERYLRTPQENPAGYESASISNVTNFKDVERFLIMHGSGDDNVHFQNSLSLLDDFNLAGVENFDFMVFPDSDHSISYHNGNNVVFDRIKNWLGRAFDGEFVAHN